MRGGRGGEGKDAYLQEMYENILAQLATLAKEMKILPNQRRTRGGGEEGRRGGGEEGRRGGGDIG